jgi:hypothetical protein
MEDTIQIDKAHIEARIKDWTKRISDLYSLIDSWLDGSQYSLKTGAPVPMYEEMMSKFGIKQVDINTADIYAGSDLVLSIKPRGLWVIGANGRVDILSKKSNNILVDFADQFKAPKWKLFNGKEKSEVDFNQDVLLNLLKK